MPRPRKPASPFRYFNSSPEVIRLVVMMYVRFPLSLRNVEDLLFERGIDLCHETVRMWWNRFGPMFAGDIITAVNGGAEVGTLPELLADLRGLDKEAIISVERNGKSVNVRSPLNVVADPLKARSINFSGLIIGRPWRLDDFDFNPDNHLIVEWYEMTEEASLSGIEVSDYILSVDGRRFSEIDQLYSYLDQLPEGTVVEFMVKRLSKAMEFYSEYHQISLARTKLDWVTAE